MQLLHEFEIQFSRRSGKHRMHVCAAGFADLWIRAREIKSKGQRVRICTGRYNQHAIIYHIGCYLCFSLSYGVQISYLLIPSGVKRNSYQTISLISSDIVGVSTAFDGRDLSELVALMLSLGSLSVRIARSGRAHIWTQRLNSSTANPLYQQAPFIAEQAQSQLRIASSSAVVLIEFNGFFRKKHFPHDGFALPHELTLSLLFMATHLLTTFSEPVTKNSY